MNPINFDLTVAVPAYGRVNEMEELLKSISMQTAMPRELLICEDNSPERFQLSMLCAKWADFFSKAGCSLKFVENKVNLGYDGNVREIFENSSSKWVLLLGNDDVLLPRCVEIIKLYLEKYPNTICASRTFLRFDESPSRIIGVSKLFKQDTLIAPPEFSSKYIFRSCGFVGGLLFSRAWAKGNSTNRFDGSLYYQIYLACLAYCERGIGYIGTPTIAGRADNKPLFGSAESENSVHIPGGYTPKGRAKMWKSVIEIFDEIGKIYSIDLGSDIRRELAGRQAFHVFEMLSIEGHTKNSEMKSELENIGLFFGAMPRLLYFLNWLLGKNARYFYYLVRKVLQ